MTKAAVWMCLGIAGAVLSDEIRLNDRSVLTGTLTSINESEVELDTSFAGPLRIDRALLSSFSTDRPVFVRLNDGRTVFGAVSADENGALRIAAGGQAVSVPPEGVEFCWVDQAKDPDVLEKKAQERSWSSQVSLNLNGSAGNTEKSSFGTEARAVLSGPEDELRLYTLYSTSEDGGVKSAEELKGGFRYANYLNGTPWGLYVREELEKDEFEQIRLRSVTAGGFSIRLARKENFKLSVQAGVSYRFEQYENGQGDSCQSGLDFGVQHFYRWENRLKMNNELTYTPLIADFADYLISQNSSLDFPVPGTDLWKVRMGIRNQFNSQPSSGREKLDTTYYTGFAADWN